MKTRLIFLPIMLLLTTAFSAIAIEPPYLIEDAPIGDPLQPEILTVFDGGCCFVARGGVWYTDGTQENTRRLMTIFGIEETLVSRGMRSMGNAVLLHNSYMPLGDDASTAQVDFYIFRNPSEDDGRFDYVHFEPVTDFPWSMEYSPTMAFAFLDETLCFAGKSWDDTGEELRSANGLVADIWPGPESSSPNDFYVADARLFFSADDGANGRELWMSDGTPEGTHLLADIATGGDSSNPTVLGSTGNVLIVSAETPDTGRELWSVNSTTGAIALLSDIAAVGAGSDPEGGVLFGVHLYFTVIEDELRTLWATDGTSLGTRKVFEAPEASVVPGSLCIHGQELLFRTTDGAQQTWWASDGTADGTKQVPTDPPTPLLSSAATRWRIGDNYFFAADQGQWQIPVQEESDQLLGELPNGTGRGVSRALNVNGKLFLSYDWRYFTGYPSGDLLHLDFNSQQMTTVLHAEGLYDPVVLEEFAGVNGLLFTTAVETCCGFEEVYLISSALWQSDGSHANSSRLLFYEGEYLYGPTFQIRLPYRGHLLFYKDALMISDGTTDGTYPLMEQTPASPFNFQEFNNLMYFLSEEAMVTDGTKEGTRAIELLPEETPFQSYLGAGEFLFLRAGDIIWRSDGTAAGTDRLALPGGPQLVEFLGMWQDRAVVWVGETELWATDGTIEGSIRLLDDYNHHTMEYVASPRWLAVYPSGSLDWLRFAPPLPDASQLVEGVAVQQFQEPLRHGYWVNDTFFFQSSNASYGEELWYARADITSPVEVLDIMPGPEGAAPRVMFGAADTVVFTEGPPADAQSIWAFDPTSGNPAESYLINPYYGADFRFFSRFGDKLIFQADDFFHGYAFWGFDLGTSLLSITREGVRKTSDATVDFLVTFTDPVQGLTVTDLALKTWFLKGANIQSVKTVSPTQFRVSVNTGLGDGTLLLMMREDHNVVTPEGARVLLPTDKDYDEGEVYDVLRLPHAADQDGDSAISLSELLRIVQFFNVGALHCEAGTEDGYATGQGDSECSPHSSDYNPQDWKINISELVRAIQVFNTGGYTLCESGEDGFCLQ